MDGEEFWITVRYIGVGTVIVAFILVCVLALTGTFGPLFNQVDNANFNSSQQHQEAVVNIFVSDCRQIAQAKTHQDVLALENDIYENVGTVDLDQLSMSQTTRTCVKKAVADINAGK